MYEWALLSSEVTFGLEHPSTLRAVNDLGVLFSKMGRWDEAEKMFERALSGKETTLGEDHPSIVKSVWNLGIMYKKRRKLDEAERMYDRALAGSKKTVGLNHPLTAEIMNDLGVLYTGRGKFADAEKMFKLSLATKDEILGMGDASTLQTANSLGLLYAEQGKLYDAANLSEFILRGCKEALRQEHPNIVVAMRRLCSLLARVAFEAKFHIDSSVAHSDRDDGKALGIDPQRMLSDCVYLCQQLSSFGSKCFAQLGRILLWFYGDFHAIAAFEQQIRLIDNEWQHFESFCYGCFHQLNLQTGRLICRTCLNVDICLSCYQKYERNEVKVEGCESHSFLSSPRPDWKLIPRGTVSLDGETVESWLERLKTLHLQISNDTIAV